MKFQEFSNIASLKVREGISDFFRGAKLFKLCSPAPQKYKATFYQPANGQPIMAYQLKKKNLFSYLSNIA